MKRIVNSIISVILAISMVLCTNLINVNAQERSTQLSKGQYLIINSKKNKLGYFKEGILVKEFSVATGKSSTPTPQGKFKIVNKIKNRPYYSGGIPGGSPNNPLGDRWLGLHVGATYGTTYAIHGNNNASSIGKHVSGGCIRMHNSEIRWLFDQINVGAYAIIDNSDKTFVQIAAKYGIKLAGVESQNIKNLKRAYNEFINYKGIDLLSKDSIITNINDVESILASKYNYINAYNKLNSSEKNNAEVKEINTNFNRIIELVEFAQASIRFYNNISINADYIAQDIDWTRRLNTYDSDEFGTRGKALKEYNDIVGFENKDNSARIKYWDKIYTESVLFLNVIEYIYGEKRSELNSNVLAHVKEKFYEYGIIIDSVNFSRIELDDETAKAIQERINKQQELETAKIEAQKAEIEAERKKVEAQGEADAKIIKAQGEAEANKILTQDLNDEILSKMYIEKWDGVLPKVTSGDISPLLDLNNIE